MPTGLRPDHMQLPPRDRAYWRAPDRTELPLLYLAWGARQFGSDPIFPALHPGWVYVVVESGSPSLVCNRRSEPIKSPCVLIFRPDILIGWNDKLQRVTRFLTWMWRHPVTTDIATLGANAFRYYSLAHSDLKLLQLLHADCRRETQLLDRHSVNALNGLQRTLEARLARISESNSSLSPKQNLNRAQMWLKQHLDCHRPLSRLADYLALSPSSVQRLFRQHAGKTVRQVINEGRLHEAQWMLTKKGMSIKEVAFRLGYRHAHDFSRAFLRGSGVIPSAVQGSLSASSPSETNDRRSGSWSSSRLST